MNRYRLIQIDFDGTETASGILEVNIASPKTLYLSQNYPNPFNPSTKIKYSLPKTRQVTIRVINVQGQQIRLLVDMEQAAGSYQMVWDGRDYEGLRVPNGVYFIEIRTDGESRMKKCVLAR